LLLLTFLSEFFNAACTSVELEVLDNSDPSSAESLVQVSHAFRQSCPTIEQTGLHGRRSTAAR
jgi:hypothetical protein